MKRAIQKLTVAVFALLMSGQYAFAQMEPVTPCATDFNGGYIQTAPFWQTLTNPPRMFLISSNCSPNPRLGVGIQPTAKLHVRLPLNDTLPPLLIDKSVSGNPNIAAYKLLQLDHTGLLYAREVKVNLENWPDYVFDEGYRLMDLEDLAAYIEKNKHLPNVPSACEMEEQGINVAKANVMLMEKVEELTLYMLRINEQLQEQKTLLEQQQETIRLQQELIRQLKEQVNP